MRELIQAHPGEYHEILNIAKTFVQRCIDKLGNQAIFKRVEEFEKSEDEYYRNRYLLYNYINQFDLYE